ncbi:hypothetical protein R6Q59_019386 [Mikania micrantha]
MASQGIHGNLLEVTVVSCSKLKDTEWISRQDPYVCIEYGSSRSTTRTCTDGGKNPTFQEKFVFTLIEGLRELNVSVWNSNTITHDDFIGNGKIPLAKALSQGFDDSCWPLQSTTGRHAGEVRIIIHHHTNVNKPPKDYSTQKPSKGYPTQEAMYSAPPPPLAYNPPPGGAYHPPYPSFSGVYPPAPYPPQPVTYPPPPYPPNPAYGSHYPPGSPFPGMYPPPPY